jgi:microcystin-dependent protein
MEFLLGQIIPFAGNFAPRNFMPCDGRLLAISSNTALFSLLGTMYGGNGQTNFALPDLRGSTVVSAGQAHSGTTYDIGQTGGSESVTATVNEMPIHTHTVAASATIHANDGRADTSSPAGAALAQTEATIYTAEPDGATTMNAGSIVATVTVGPSGGSQAMPTMSPYLVVNYLICVNGIFPQRP